VICYVTGSNPPIFMMESYIKRVWGKHDVERIVDFYDGLFLVRSESVEQRDAACKGHFSFDKKPLIVRG